MSLIELMGYIGIAALLATLVMTYVFKVHKSWLMTFLQNFTGILFLFSGWVKVVDPLGTAFKMQDYFAEFYATFAETRFGFLAPVFPFLSSYSGTFAVAMIIFEIVLGIMLIIGYKPRLTALLFLVLILLFTVLTGFTFLTGYVPMDANFFDFSAWGEYKATNMRVTDCGCFGDFIKLEPRTSFYKDIFLLIPGFYFLWRWKDMHQLVTARTGLAIVLGSLVLLLGYSVYYTIMDEPQIDFRPFRNGANIAAIKKTERDAANAVQVLAMKMKNKTTGEIKQFAYADYLKNLDKITQEYETIEQIKTEPAIKETKISHFDITDFEGNEKTDVYLANPKAQLMIPVYHAEYTAIPVNKTVKDSVFIYDTIRIAGKDSMNIVKTFKEVSEKEVVDYNIRWNKEFLRQFNDVIRPLVEAAANDGVGTGVVISGIDQEKADLLAKETGLKAEFHTADEKLLKTIMRSNPGIILWKNGVLLQKWHYKKVPSWSEIKNNLLN
jgi:uncharacterized membrane protein YphA (DoxX/SURF4 family)